MERKRESDRERTKKSMCGVVLSTVCMCVCVRLLTCVNVRVCVRESEGG